MEFKVQARVGKARLGILRLDSGVEVETPAFMPVATTAAIKGLPFEILDSLDYRIILGNSYHLMERPGSEMIRDRGGLHGFTGWKKGWLTDSGGYQVFSLAKHRVLDQDGVEFRSLLDGSLRRLTPENVVKAQEDFGSDIAMCLDVCPAPGRAGEEITKAVDLTLAWARRSREAWKGKKALFGILQGGLDPGERERCAAGLLPLDFPGYALGGISVGESIEDMRAMTRIGAALLPEAKPRYLMGVGSPGEMLDAVDQGVDLFDCVLPTRQGRHGFAYTSEGPLRIKGAAQAERDGPLDPACPCPVCRRHSRAYLRHLFAVGNPTGAALLSHHNLAYFAGLMASLREQLRMAL